MRLSSENAVYTRMNRRLPGDPQFVPGAAADLHIFPKDADKLLLRFADGLAGDTPLRDQEPCINSNTELRGIRSIFLCT